MESRRKSTVHVNSAKRERGSGASAHIELERLEQETTLVLQEIDRNLSQANAVITDKILPVLTKYHSALSNVWGNVSFWKRFVEEASETKVCPEESKVDGDTAQTGFQQTESTSEKNDMLNELDMQQNSTLTSDFQMEASTPQLKSRHLLQPSTSPQRSATRYPRVLISPRKRGSGRYDATDPRRLSMLQNFLNSSPTLPEPPKLTSDVNHHLPSSSGVSKTNHSDPIPDPAAVRLLLPAEVTPKGRQRFPRTPTFGSGTGVGRSPMKNIPSLRRGNEDLDQVLPVPRMTSINPGDDSDQVPLPQLQTILVGASVNHSPTQGEESVSKRRRTEGDESENVFLDANYKDDTNNNSRSHSIVYNTIRGQSEQQAADQEAADQEEIESGEQKSKSVSQIFEDVLQPSPEKKQQEKEAEENAPNIANVTQNLLRSIDQTNDSTVNSSELGSVLGERWKALTRTLRKST